MAGMAVGVCSALTGAWAAGLKSDQNVWNRRSLSSSVIELEFIKRKYNISAFLSLSLPLSCCLTAFCCDGPGVPGCSRPADVPLWADPDKVRSLTGELSCLCICARWHRVVGVGVHVDTCDYHQDASPHSCHHINIPHPCPVSACHLVIISQSEA